MYVAHLIGQIPDIAAARLIATNPLDLIASDLVTAHRGCIGRLVGHHLAILEGSCVVHASNLVEDLQARLHPQEVVHHGQTILVHVADDVTAQILIAALTAENQKGNKDLMLITFPFSRETKRKSI